MAGLLYHFPGQSVGDGKSTAEQELFKKCDLADVLDHASLNVTDVTFPGPGGSGTLVAPVVAKPGKLPPMRYKPGEQVWLDCKTHWIGWEKAEPPTPYDLARDDMLDGHPVWIAGKHQWIIPAVSALPCGYSRNEAGEIVQQLQVAFADLDALAQRIWDRKPVTKGEAFVATCRMLRINYRLPERVCWGDGCVLVGDRETEAALFALIDGPTLKAEMDAQKKMAG